MYVYRGGKIPSRIEEGLTPGFGDGLYVGVDLRCFEDLEKELW